MSLSLIKATTNLQLVRLRSQCQKYSNVKSSSSQVSNLFTNRRSSFKIAVDQSPRFPKIKTPLCAHRWDSRSGKQKKKKSKKLSLVL
ncbi:hypothetical protein FKM82_028181 [Ascaphus truei]